MKLWLSMRLKESLKKVKKRPSLFGISFLSVCVVLFLLLLDFRYWRWQANLADTAYFHEITNSLSKGSWFGSHFGGSTGVDFTHILQNPLANSLGQIPDFPLDSQPSQFYNHAYLILIPIALLSLIVRYKILIDSLDVLITLAPFVMLIFVLRRSYLRTHQRKLILVGLLVAVILVCFPGINYIALGQFYPDRLIILFLPLTMLAFERLDFTNDRRSIVIFVVLAVLSMSVTERGSLYVAFVTLGMLFFRILRNRNNFEITLRRNFSILATGLAAFAWSVIYVKMITHNADTASTSSSITRFSWTHNQLFTSSSLKLILLCLPLLLIASRYWDLLIIGSISIFPNLLGTYMFNLRTAWFAHYMSYFTATLIGTCLIALKRDAQKQILGSDLRTVLRNIPKRVVFASSIAVLSVYLINPVTETKLFEPNNQIQLGAFTQAKLWWSNPSYRQLTKEVIRNDYALANQIPANSSVVATENTAQLVGGRVKNVDYFPINLTSDEYVLIFSASPFGQPFSASEVTDYASLQGSLAMTAEATKLLYSDCYEIVNRNVNANLYLFHRIKVITDDSVCHPRNN